MGFFYSRIDIKSPPLSISMDTSYSQGLLGITGVSVNQSKTFVNDSAEIFINKIITAGSILSDEHKELLSSAINIIKRNDIYKECRERTPDKKILVMSIRFFDLFHIKNSF